MNPPKCKACGETEWQHVCVLDKAAVSVELPPDTKAPKKGSLEGRVATLEAAVAGLCEGLPPTDKRRGYMREYMRKRRAGQ